MAAATGLVA